MEEKKVKWLFMVDYYDCVLSAVVLDEDDNYLFAVRDWHEELDDYTGRFLLYEIPTDRLVEILGWHELFKRYVGNNCDFLDDGRLGSEVAGPPKRNIGDLQSQNKWKRFYDAYNQDMRLDVKNQSPVGYCCD